MGAGRAKRSKRSTHGRGGVVRRHTLSKPTTPAPTAPKTSKSLKTERLKADTTLTPPTKSCPTSEKRLRRFRGQPPQSFDDIYQRATTQRFFVLSRTRGGDAQCPEETVELTGTTGNIYTVHIAKQPSCDCPHAEKGHQCKHWLYVMSRVLKARYEYVYQLALLSTELQEIFAGAPPILDPASSANDKNRKPVEDDCPICFGEFDKESDQIVWCRAACGQNLHKQCFDMWSAAKGQGKITCPFCRSPWESDPLDITTVVRDDRVNSEGYVNIAGQLGISGERDYSSYSRWWGRSRRMRYY